LIEDARSRQSSEHRDLARLLELLERRIDSLGKAEAAAAEARAALEAEKVELARVWEKRESTKIREIERRTDELIKAFESRARVTLDQIAAGADQKKAAQQGERRVAQARRELREDVGEAIAATRKPEAGEAAPKPVTEGSRVRLRGVREPGRVRRLLTGGNIEVEAGFLKLQVPLEDVVEVLPETSEGAKLPKGVTLNTGPRFETLSREINVIGKRAEEAAAEVDKFLDSAALASVMRVRIVHGHGMGILKKTIAELLAGHPLVGKFYAAPPQEGGAGATIVEMRDAD
jgi:DNA mismatch repair protein MutS2